MKLIFGNLLVSVWGIAIKKDRRKNLSWSSLQLGSKLEEFWIFEKSKIRKICEISKIFEICEVCEIWAKTWKSRFGPRGTTLRPRMTPRLCQVALLVCWSDCDAEIHHMRSLRQKFHSFRLGGLLLPPTIRWWLWQLKYDPKPENQGLGLMGPFWDLV